MKARANFLVWAALAATALTWLSWVVPAPADKVVFLDVGQGDAILVQAGTAQVLIDGGLGNTVLTRLAEEMPWFDRRLDVVVVTHPQRDHMEGLLHVISNYDVGLVLMPQVASASQLQAAWLEELLEQNLPVRFARAGQTLVLGDARMQILGPLSLDVKDINDASVVARVDFTPSGSPSLEGESLSFLLTGDAEKKAEGELVARYHPLLTSPSFEGEGSSVLDVDVLKAGHHGSNTSTHGALLKATSPQAVVISVGKENTYGHPHPKVLERLAGIPTWRTDENGSIKLEWTDRGWFLK